jgi:type IV pilus assembly protein PilM
MLNTKSYLAVDFGAGSLKLAEFEVNEAGGLRLKQYGLRSLGQEGLQETTREAAVQKALQEMLTERGIKAKNANVCAPGFHVFSKFVKLPPVEASKVTQMIQYEAQQNVPFPLEEVVWDYQILGSSGGGELEVLLIAIKAEVVEGLFRVAESSGLRLQVADVSAAALCNAFRYNYGELEDCTMLLDIGAKTSNLLFFEKGKVYSRSINLGANSITQDFATETKKKWDMAEKIKIAEGFVSLGGAYEEPENQDQAAISKIARQFMTRLHIQVNQTLQFYRGQQGGAQPARLFLSGGASIMPYTAQFFAEKLNVPVEYFNPLRNVQIDPSINLEELAHVAHSMGEVVGLGLRNLAHCPVELNLMPESTLRWQSFNQKKPYFIAAISGLVIVVAAIGFLLDKLAGVKDVELQKTKAEVEPQQRRAQAFTKAFNELKRTQDQVLQLGDWMNDRYYWADVMNEMRQVLIRVEAGMKAKLRTDTGVWVEQFISAQPTISLPPGMTPDLPPPAGGRPMTPEMDLYMRRYGLPPGAPAPGGAEVPMAPAMPPPVPAESAAVPPPVPGEAVPGMPMAGASGSLTNEPGTVEVVFRAVSLTKISASANTDTAFAVLNELKASSLVDAEKTRFSGNISADEPPGTFTFSISLKLKRPIKL